MPLTDTSIRTAKPGTKPVKMYDERGLFLIVTPTGGKWWRFRFTFDGKEKLLSLGTYPDVSLKDARERRDANRKLLANGVNPSENRKMQKSVRADQAANSFEIVAREWYAKYSTTWSANHGDRIIRRLERDIFPWIGGQPITDINAPMLLKVVLGLKAEVLSINTQKLPPINTEKFPVVELFNQLSSIFLRCLNR